MTDIDVDIRTIVFTVAEDYEELACDFADCGNVALWKVTIMLCSHVSYVCETCKEYTLTELERGRAFKCAPCDDMGVYTPVMIKSIESIRK